LGKAISELVTHVSLGLTPTGASLKECAAFHG
jgi:hypothetical protein